MAGKYRQPGYEGKGIIHVLGGAERDSEKFHHAAQNGMQFKMCESFISGIFQLIFLDCSSLQVTETTESKTMNKGNNCVKIPSHLGVGHQHMNFRGHSSVHSTWL